MTNDGVASVTATLIYHGTEWFLCVETCVIDVTVFLINYHLNKH